MRKLFLRGRSVLRSIASLPAIIFLAFIVLAALQLAAVSCGWRVPDSLRKFDVTDLDTIRTTLAAVITGVFTLTIFAYTMVMNVIDRSISSYSPRLLPLILSERYHQEVLGVGAGTIAHSIILLLGVAEPPEVAQPPPLAAASAGFFAVISLILFIYFIHRVSRSIHINALLYKSFCHTRKCLQEIVKPPYRLVWAEQSNDEEGRYLVTERCGYLEEIDLQGLAEETMVVEVVAKPGSFLYAGDRVLRYREGGTGSDNNLTRYYRVSDNEPIDVYYVGFRHLVEVAIKAASPALNDPATSLTAMHYLVQLFEDLAAIGRYNAVEQEGRSTKLQLNTWTPEELIHNLYRELRRYLGEDPWGQAAIRSGLQRIERSFSTHHDPQAAAAARLEASLLS